MQRLLFLRALRAALVNQVDLHPCECDRSSAQAFSTTPLMPSGQRLVTFDWMVCIDLICMLISCLTV